MSVRLTRVERKERTRSDLLEAARRAFMRRGFHRATLGDIAEEAGYTKGAVYSNFADKDALFLAVLRAHYESRIEAYQGIILEGDSYEDTIREVSRFMAEADTREPDWLPLLTEFIAHAARNDDLREEYRRVREGFLEAIADVIEALGKRHGATLRVSPLDAARGSSILARGFSAERQLDPSVATPELFEEIHTGYVLGLTIREESKP